MGLFDWLIDGLINWLTDWRTDLLTDWLTDWLTLLDWLMGWLMDWLVVRKIPKSMVLTWIQAITLRFPNLYFIIVVKLWVCVSHWRVHTEFHAVEILLLSNVKTTWHLCVYVTHITTGDTTHNYVCMRHIRKVFITQVYMYTHVRHLVTWWSRAWHITSCTCAHAQKIIIR